MRSCLKNLLVLGLLTSLGSTSSAFVSPSADRFSTAFHRPTISRITNIQFDNSAPASLQRQRRSVSNVQTMGLFGLGAPEIAVILVAVAIVVGPQNLGNMAGNLAGQAKSELDGLPEELKKIPEEFQKGVEEGEGNARARNAKQMKAPPKELKEGSKDD